MAADRRSIYNGIATKLKEEYRKGNLTKEQYREALNKAFDDYENGHIVLHTFEEYFRSVKPAVQAAPPSSNPPAAGGGPNPPDDEIEKRLRKIYTQAQKELKKGLQDFVKKQSAKAAEMQQKLRNGEITQEEYRDWMNRNIFRTDQWKQKVDQVTGTLLNSNTQAMQIINDEKMGVYADNANYQAYQLTKDTGLNLSFSVYDVDAVGRLIRQQPELLPRKVVNGKKDKAWNTLKIANAVSQGIIQGESIPDLARRIARDTTSDNMDAMIRYARTAMTGAQNAGRMDTLHRAQGMGIVCKKCWLATLDSRTRDSHREMDGVMVGVDEKFETPLGSKMEYPGDLAGKGGDVWNCRCTLTYEYEGYEGENAERIAYEEGVDKNGKPYRRSTLIKDMNYKQWLEWKTSGDVSPARHKIVDGVDLTGIWKRRNNEFKTEIEDIINSQGFDNNPQVVSAEEFEKAVKASGIIAQRAYKAKDQKTLDQYTDELYHGGPGHWYVDSSVGGDSYGQGMYGAYSMNGKITKDMKSAMEMYRKDNKGSVSKVETFTLTPDAKIISLEDLYEMEDVEKYRKQLEIYKSKRTGEESIDNITSLAALKGYDAVVVDGEGEMIVLNRSKCIFLDERSDSQKKEETRKKTETEEQEQTIDETARKLIQYVNKGQAWADRLSEEEKRAIWEYGYNYLSAETNGWLRHNESAWNISQEADIEKNIEKLDAVIGKEELGEAMTLYRGVGKDFLGLDFGDPDKLIGQTVEDRGYQSTSATEEIAAVYSRGVVLEIEAPKNTHTAYVDLAKSTGKELIEYYNHDGDPGNIEYLLERGCELKFTGYTREKTSDGKEYLKMKCELVTRQEKRDRQIDEIMTSVTTKPMTADQKKEFKSVLQGMSDQNLRLYHDITPFHKKNKYHEPGKGWYSPNNRIVEMDISQNKWETKVGRNTKAAWNTKFHEEMHQLDHILSRTSGTKGISGITKAKFTNATPTGKKLASAIEKDVISFINKGIDESNKWSKTKTKHIRSLTGQIDSNQINAFFNLLTKKTAGNTYDETIKNKVMAGAFTDAVGLATEGKIDPYGKGWWGHDAIYDKDRKINGATSELFAEIGSYMMRNDREALQYLEMFMPNAVLEYKRALREQAEYARNNRLHY